jgi:hypothetical protein
VKPGNSGPEKPGLSGLSGVSGFFPEIFGVQTSIVNLSLPYPVTYPDNVSEDPSRDRGALHPKEDQG